MTRSKLPMVVLTAVLLILLVFSPSSDACSCVDRWAPHRLCCRDIVLHGEVQSERLIGNSSKPYQQERVFTVKVLEVFKGLERIKNMSKDYNTSYVQIFTSTSSCGISLGRQQSFVVSGSVDRQNRMESQSCQDWHLTWENVPNSYKEFFPMLKTCKCAANTNHVGSFFFLLSMLLTALNMN